MLSTTVFAVHDPLSNPFLARAKLLNDRITDRVCQGNRPKTPVGFGVHVYGSMVGCHTRLRGFQQNQRQQLFSCGRSSAGRALSFQVRCRVFKSRRPLQIPPFFKNLLKRLWRNWHTHKVEVLGLRASGFDPQRAHQLSLPLRSSVEPEQRSSNT